MFSCCRKNHTEKVLTYYPDSKIKTSYNYLNGKKHGLCIDYYHNGNIEFEYTYKNGLKNGEYRLYRINGEIFESGTLVDNRKHGLIRIYDSERYALINYKNDLLHGESITYFNNGQIHIKCDYKNGQQDRCVVYSESRNLIYEYISKYAKSISYYDTGEKNEVIYYNRSKYETRYIVYYKSGAIKVDAVINHRNETKSTFKYYTEDGGPLYDEELIDFYEGILPQLGPQ